MERYQMSVDTSMTVDDQQSIQEDQNSILLDELSDNPAAEAIEEQPINADENYEEYNEPPLNAEEATILVVHFLQRMKKKVVTPRKATLNTDSVFVVNVDLQEAIATVHINAENREITEYSIETVKREPKPLPIPPRKVFIALGAALLVVVAVIVQSFIMLYAENFLANVNTDYLIIGGAIALVATGVIVWRRRG
jgi:hypothetical protein